MTTKTHAILTTLFCFTSCITIFKTDIPLIGLLHGPSDEINALHQQQSIQTKLLTLAAKKQNDEDIWHSWAESSVFEPYDEIAYRDQSAAILRDAGIVAAFFTLILVLFPNVTSIFYSKSQRLMFTLLALPLYIMPGLVGQVVFQKTIPIENQLLEVLGPAKGLSYIGYCSLKSLLVGLGGQEDGGDDNGSLSAILAVLHDIKVVMSAGLLVFVVLGLMPPEK